MSLWQRLLQGNEPPNYGIYTEEKLTSSTSYTQLLTKVILPAVIIATKNSWEPRNSEPMLCFLETLEKLLLASEPHKILDHIVMPKLIITVDTFDPEYFIMFKNSKGWEEVGASVYLATQS